MTSVNDAGNKVTKWIRWIARIWGTLIIAFALLMLIGYAWNWVATGKADPHAVEDIPPIEYLGPAFMLLGALGLGIAWRWERLGGAITAVSQLAFLTLSLIEGLISLDRRFVVPCLMSIIIATPGILFLVCWW